MDEILRYLTHKDQSMRDGVKKILKLYEEQYLDIKNISESKWNYLINIELANINGKRRKRILYPKEIYNGIISCCNNPEKNSIYYITGGYVANSYGYYASATAVLILRMENILAINIKIISAKTNTTGFGRLDLITKEKNSDLRLQILIKAAYQNLIFRIKK